MKGPIARLLVVILNILSWVATIYCLATPFVAGWIALQYTTDHWFYYSALFAGIFAFWFVIYYVTILVVRFFQYIFLGSTKRADLFFESQADLAQFQELLDREGCTAEMARMEMDEIVRNQKEIMGKLGLITWVVVYAIGALVVVYLT